MPILSVSDYRTPVALVTGGAKRVGRAMVLQLVEMGFQVAVHYFGSVNEAASLVAEVKSKSGKAKAFQANLNSASSAQDLFEKVEADLGSPSVVINNASIFVPERLHQLDPERLEQNLALHVTVPLVLSKLMLAEATNVSGESLILNMLDQRVLNPSPGFVSYNASKCALAGITKSLAIELAPRIRVNGIAPGPVLPPPSSDGSGFDDYCRTMPLERGSSPSEIAHLLKFIVEASAMTGQIIASDGGQHLGHMSQAEAVRNLSLKLNQG